MAGFDWVTERNKCSIGIVFQRLAGEIEADVKTREEQLREDRTHYGFQCEREQSAIVVHVRGNKIRGSVEIAEQANEIVVKDPAGKIVHRATLTLNDLGECRLRVKDKELETWQFRKLALEQFLFHEY